jgi:ATP-binding protein involved in chromosome partitioning
MSNKDKILQELEKVKHPETRESIVEMGMVDNLMVNENEVSLGLKFKKAKDPFAASLKKSVEVAIKKVDSGFGVIILDTYPPVITGMVKDPLADIKNIIAVASGKGGVGKSTVAVNLAVSMAKTGASVGLIDADVYGPSLPIMFDLQGQRPAIKKVGDKDLIIPIEKHGVKLNSIGFFVSAEDALVWRGPMATSALKQLLSQTDWGRLDYLFIDLPPGTGDIHLTMVQEMPVTGAVIVSTPQEVALADAIKGIAMFTGEKINVPVLGLIENMAWFTPAELPENKYYIFGKEGVKKLAQKLGMELLGQIPLVQSICEDGDSGHPTVLDENNPAGQAFEQLALNLMKNIEKRNAEKAPTKKVEINQA